MPSRNVYWKKYRRAIDRINERMKGIGAGWRCKKWENELKCWKLVIRSNREMNIINLVCQSCRKVFIPWQIFVSSLNLKTGQLNYE